MPPAEPGMWAWAAGLSALRKETDKDIQQKTDQGLLENMY